MEKLALAKKLQTILTRCDPQHKRAEQVVGQFDFVVSRAVTKMKVFHVNSLSIKSNVSKTISLYNGLLYLR